MSYLSKLINRFNLGYLEANDFNYHLSMTNANLDISFNIGYFIGYTKVKVFGYQTY